MDNDISIIILFLLVVFYVLFYRGSFPQAASILATYCAPVAMERWRGRVALVTRDSAGIGYCVTKALVQ